MTYDPANTIPAMPDGVEQEKSRTWSLEEGETRTTTYRGKHSVLEALYNEKVDLALDGSPEVASLELRVTNGRASLMVRSVDQSYGGSGGGGGDYKVGVEELYAIDVTRDVASHPMYENLSAEQILAVKKSIAENQDATTAADEWNETPGGTTEELNLMLNLYSRLSFGETSYLETGYIFRRTYIAKSDLVVLSLLGTVNQVITQATLTADLNVKTKAIIDGLPSGEWLVRAPAIDFMGMGRYHIKEEYQWAPKWSDLYGGSRTYQ